MTLDAHDVASGFARRGTSMESAGHVALMCGTTALTYRELWGQVNRAAGCLAELGVGRGDVVAVAADPSVEYVVYTLATLAVGAVHCPLETAGAEILLDRIATSGARLVVADASARARLAGARLDTRVWPADAPLGDASAPRVYVAPDDGAVLLSTSGSTGERKNILLTHANVLSNARGVVDRTDLTPADRLLNCMPLYHTNALNNQLLAPLLVGATVLLHRRFVPDRFADWLVGERPTYTTGSPTMFRRLLAHDLPARATSSLRFVRGGAAPFTASFHEQVEDHLGVPLVVSWGLTEATCTSAMNPPGARRIGTVGTPLAGQDVAVLDFDRDTSLPAGERGEIGIRGPSVAPQFGAGWLRTGDIGIFDDDGYLSIVGRRKDVIIRGGENVHPQEVETILAAHPETTQCCVVGAPSEEFGEVPVAYVVRRRADTMTDAEMTEQLLGLAARRLPGYAVPVRIVMLDELPTIGVGKIDRPTMRRLASSEVAG